MSANISYALDNFEREAARKNGERATRRLNRMFGAFSATNEAILRAKTEQELYQLVCDAAVHSGKSVATVVLLAEPDSIWLKPVAGTGAIVSRSCGRRSRSIPETPMERASPARRFERRSLPSTAISATRPGAAVAQAHAKPVSRPASRVPLIKAGESVGVLLFFVGKSWAEDEEIVALMARIAENVSFALDNFDRATTRREPTHRKTA